MKPVAPSDFKHAMRYLAGAVTIVTTGSGGERRGLTATAVCSLSAEPPRVIACINRNGITYEMISKSRTLGINILSSAHESLAMRFAGMKDIGDVDRFGEGRWRTLTTGAPILDDALTAFDCTLNVAIDVGSHAIIVADIVDIRNNGGGEPLLYMESAFKTIAPALTRAAASVAR